MRLRVLVCLCGFVAVRAQNPPAAKPPLAQQKPVNVIEGIEFSGSSGVQPSTLSAAIFSKVGDAYDELVLRRDLAALWDTKRFTDIRINKERGSRGGIVLRFLMTGRPKTPPPVLASNVIEGIEFSGASGFSLDTLRDTIHTKPGDTYDEDSLRGDFNAIWNTNRYSSVQLKKETGGRGGVVLRFVLNEPGL